MKISKAQKAKNNQSIIDSFVKLSAGKKFKEVSMKAIAKEASLSDAAIYNYFPSKEELVIGYFYNRIQLAINDTKNSEDFNDLTFSERIQWLLETYLERVNDEKGVLEQTVNQLVEQPISIAKTGLGEAKKIFVEFVTQELEAAVVRGEFSEPPFMSFLSELVWDMYLGLLHYWLKDDSEQSLNTTHLLELSLELLLELLKGEVFSKVYKISHFLFREHLLSKLLSFGAPVAK